MIYLTKKIFILFITLVLVSLAVFFVFQILPGEPALIILGPEADEAQVAALSRNLGLDEPLAIRYINWAASIVKGDMGISIRYNRPVSELIASRLPVTLALTAMSVLISAFFGFLMGIITSKYSDSFVGRVLSAISQLGLAIPSFWMGLMLALVFGLFFSILPTGGFIPFGDSVSGALKSLLLPSVALAAGNTAILIRFLKNSINSNMNEDYVRTAKSRGLSENSILFRHVLRNALLPSITILGMIITDTISGSIIIENVFSLPGLGQLIVTAIHTRDLPLIQSLCLYISFTVVIVNTAVDILYTIIDPRIHLN